MPEPKDPREPRIPTDSPTFDADNRWTRTWIMYFESLFKLSVKEAVRLAGTVTHTTGALTKDLPVFGNDKADIKVGTKSGDTNEVATVAGAIVTGNTVKWDGVGNLIDAGVTPGGGGGGGGTVTAVTGTAPIASSGGTTPAISIATFTGDSGSGGARGAVPAPAAGDAAALKVLGAGGGWVAGGAGTVTHTGGALTADQPVFGAGSADIKVGTKTGNTDKVVTNTGTNVTGNTVKWDASGNLIDAGAAPGGAGMAIGGPVTSGTDGSILFVASGNLAQDNADLFWDNTNKRVGIGINTPGHPLHVYATDPLVSSVPTEQVVVENPATSGASNQSNIGFKVYDGTAHKVIGWVGATCGSFTFVPGTENATYLENFSTGGVMLMADDPTHGRIRMYTGGYTDDTYMRLYIDPVGQVVIREYDGTTQGLLVQLAAQNATAAKSLANINLFDVSTLVGQLVGTASNYASSGGSVNLPASSVGLMAEITAGVLFLAAAGSSGIVRINAGGYSSTYTTAEFPAAGGMEIKRGGVTITGAPSGSYVKADGSGYGTPGGGGTTHSESLTDGGSNFIFAGGDIVTVVGVPN